MKNKELYREFCKEEVDIPIFSKDWWLDTVCGAENWDVAIIEKGREIVATMPYVKKKLFIFNTIMMPEFTQTLGPYIKYPKGQRYYKRLSWEKEMIDNLIEQLPKFDYFSQNFHSNITNWLPLYWKNFDCSIKYTYVIEDITLNELESSFEIDTRRRRRRKAEKFGVNVFEGDDINLFYELNKMTFIRQNEKTPYTFDAIYKLYEKCKEYNSVKMYFAEYEGEIIAANFLVYDDNTVYYLMGGIEPKRKDLGAMDLIQYRSIEFAIKNNKKFDFEGSMIESIEKYFRSFGAIQKPYFSIKKTNSKILNLREPLKKLIGY